MLTKAIVHASDLLGLKDSELAQVIGASPAAISRYRRGTAKIDPARKVGELSLLLVRLFRSLDTLTGSDSEKLKAWMHSQNDTLDGVPLTLICRAEGLVQTLAYLDSISHLS